MAYNTYEHHCKEGYNMAYAANILNSLVPITQFNRGQASRIFDRLHTESQLVVLKNNQPAAVILSPEEYARLSEIEEDYLLLIEATKRLADNNAPTTPMDEVMKELGITDEEIEEVTPYPFGGCERAVEIDVLAVGEGGE